MKFICQIQKPLINEPTSVSIWMWEKMVFRIFPTKRIDSIWLYRNVRTLWLLSLIKIWITGRCTKPTSRNLRLMLSMLNMLYHRQVCKGSMSLAMFWKAKTSFFSWFHSSKVNRTDRIAKAKTLRDKKTKKMWNNKKIRRNFVV